MEFVPIYSVPLWQSQYREFEGNKDSITEAIERIKTHNFDKLDQYFINVNIGFITSFVIQSCYHCAADINLSADSFFISNLSFHEKSVDIKSTEKQNLFTAILWLESDNESCITVSNVIPEWRGCDFVKNKNQYTSTEIKVVPEKGDFFIFPSYLNYSLTHNKSSCFVFDINLV